MKSWMVKRDDKLPLLAHNGAPALFKTRAVATAAAKKAKGLNYVQRIEITDIGRATAVGFVTPPKPKAKSKKGATSVVKRKRRALSRKVLRKTNRGNVEK